MKKKGLSWAAAALVPCACMVGLVVFAKRPARALMAHELASLGSQILSQTRPSSHAGATELSLNGQSLSMIRGRSELSIEKFHAGRMAVCPPEGFQVTELSRTRMVMACLDANSDDVAGALSSGADLESLDLGAGHFAYAEMKAGTLRYVAMSSSNFNPFSLLSSDQSRDVGGSDFALMPLPTGLSRRFSLQQQHGEYGFNVYSDTSRSSDELSKHYGQLLNDYGFRVEAINIEDKGQNALGLLAVKGDAMAVVVTHEEKGRTIAGISVASGMYEDAQSFED